MSAPIVFPNSQNAVMVKSCMHSVRAYAARMADGLLQYITADIFSFREIFIKISNIFAEAFLITFRLLEKMKQTDQTTTKRPKTAKIIHRYFTIMSFIESVEPKVMSVFSFLKKTK